GPMPTGAPAQLSGMGVDPAEFYGAGQQPAPVAQAPQPGGQATQGAPLVPPPTPKASRETAEQRALDVNVASEADLAQIPGMSAARAQAVLAARRAGRIDSIEKFAEVTDMPPHELAKVRHLLTFTPAEPGRANRPSGRVLDF
ncbi:MAG: helix-hairpin-helix domain-containing protein, partial [Nocardioidaceae bacterium]